MRMILSKLSIFNRLLRLRTKFMEHFILGAFGRITCIWVHPIPWLIVIRHKISIPMWLTGLRMKSVGTLTERYPVATHLFLGIQYPTQPWWWDQMHPSIKIFTWFLMLLSVVSSLVHPDANTNFPVQMEIDYVRLYNCSASLFSLETCQ